MDGLRLRKKKFACQNRILAIFKKKKKKRFYCIWISFLFDMLFHSNSVNLCAPLVPHL